MDGKTLLRDLRGNLAEVSGSGFMDDRLSYEYLYESAVEFVSKTKINTSTQDIQTVASQSTYTLNPDYMSMAYQDDQNRYYVKYLPLGLPAASATFIYDRDVQGVVYDNNVNTMTTPGTFSVTDSTPHSTLSGSATGDGALSNGESTLTDGTASFLSTVCVGDTVHNTTDGGSGYVVAVTSNTAIVTALFDGTTNEWSTSDDYIITPQGRFSIVLDPPPSSSGDTFTVYYVKRPAPVFSPYRSYNIPIGYKQALVQYACFMYKYRDMEPNFGDRYYRNFDTACRQASSQINKSLMRRSFRVNLNKRAAEDRSYR